MDAAGFLGLVAGAVTSGSFVPQIVRGWRTKHMRDVSPHMLLVMTTGLSLWLLYGALRADVIIIVANAAGLALVLTLVGLWWRYGRAAPTV